MVRQTSHPRRNRDDGAAKSVDLQEIFIGRDHQLNLFSRQLSWWKEHIRKEDQVQRDISTAPTPYSKLRGLVVVIHGHSGFGKTTLLRRFKALALKEQEHLNAGHLMISDVVDWEFAAEGKHAFFHLPHDSEPDPVVYYQLLCQQLARALNKQVNDFKQYQQASKAAEEIRRQGHRVLDALKQDERYKALGDIGSEEFINLLRWFAPRIGQALDQVHLTTYVQQALGKAIGFGIEHLAETYQILNVKLAQHLDTYLDPALQLGLALGHDLASWSRNFPLLIFFDTYEVIAQGDRLLRIVMGGAGPRVGWVVAGRDNLWDEVDLSQQRGYGYKEVVLGDHGLVIELKKSGVGKGGMGDFTTSEILEYFEQLRKLARQRRIRLPKITGEEAEQIRQMTQGVPLAIEILAGLFLETESLEAVKRGVEDVGLDKLLRRYLLHTHQDMEEQQKLYGLALLRRGDQSYAVAAALGLESEHTGYNIRGELNRLHRRYSFISPQKGKVVLHQDVRHFLRLWLLEHKDDQDIKTVNARIQAAHEKALSQLEVRRQYRNLKDRLTDEEWIELYLDFLEQQFWLDPAEGVRYTVSLLIAAAFYQHMLLQTVFQMSVFFEERLKRPASDWWSAAKDLQRYPAFLRPPSSQEMETPVILEQLAQQHRLAFPSFLPNCQDELEGLLYWYMGETYLLRDIEEACVWYERALIQLAAEPDLKGATAHAYQLLAAQLLEIEDYKAAVSTLDRAIDLNLNDRTLYEMRSKAYGVLNEFEQATADYQRTSKQATQGNIASIDSVPPSV